MIPRIDPYYNIIAVHVLMSMHTIISMYINSVVQINDSEVELRWREILHDWPFL